MPRSAAARGTGQMIVGQGTDDGALFATNGTLAVGAHGQVTLGGTQATLRAANIDVAAGGSISGAGTVSGMGGGNNTVALTEIDNDGSIAAQGGNLLLYGAVSGSGTLGVGNDATLDVAGRRRGGPDAHLRHQLEGRAQRRARLPRHHHRLRPGRRARYRRRPGDQPELGRRRADARHAVRSDLPQHRRSLQPDQLLGDVGRSWRHFRLGRLRRRPYREPRRLRLRLPGGRRVRRRARQRRRHAPGRSRS